MIEGLTVLKGEMINCLNWLGFCESYSSVSNMRNWLAAMDELVVKKQAALGVCHIIFDNLDIYIRQLFLFFCIFGLSLK